MADDLFDVFEDNEANNENNGDALGAYTLAKTSLTTENNKKSKRKIEDLNVSAERIDLNSTSQQENEEKDSNGRDDFETANPSKRFQQEDFDDWRYFFCLIDSLVSFRCFSQFVFPCLIWRESEKLPRISVLKLSSLDRCSHEVALPTDMEYQPLKNNPNTIPAKEYPFTLDPFQVAFSF
jgi:hypothetical protein